MGPGWSLHEDAASDPAPLAPWPPGLTDDRSVFAVLCGAQPAGPAQHPQVDGPSGELEGRRRRHARHSAREGTLLPAGLFFTVNGNVLSPRITDI